MSEDVIELPMVEPNVKPGIEPVVLPIDQPPVVVLQHAVAIEGIKVEMPVKPYPCQMDVMKAVSLQPLSYSFTICIY